MSKIQFRGHCQLCGRIQATNARGMAKHGYTIENRGLDGWFSGTCGGSHNGPLEKDRSLLDSVIVQIRADIVRLKGEVQDLKSGKIHPKSFDFGYSFQKKIIDWADMRPDQRKTAVDRTIWSLESRIRGGEGWIKDMLALAEKVLGQPLQEVNMAPDTSKEIVVGSQIKMDGKVYTVTKIEPKMCRGVGPSMNGKVVDHVFWERDGREFAWPKRYVRKA